MQGIFGGIRGHMERHGEQARSSFHLGPRHGKGCIAVVILRFLVLDSQLYVVFVYFVLSYGSHVVIALL